jgi:Membrane protein implicated in regulation of membrane protease activity
LHQLYVGRCTVDILSTIPKVASNGLNERGQDFIGRVYTLSSDIENGIGRLHVEDTHWKIQGDDLPAGSKVKVTGINGNILIVEKTD